jgi:DNA polymerase
MITFDFETKSCADLQKVGAWVYSEHPSTDVVCACWAIGQGEIQSWWPGKGGMPRDLKDAIERGELVEAHNVAFERSIWMNVTAPRYGWVLPAPEQWRDTMAVASYYGLPAKLNSLSAVLGFPGKNSEGGRLITRYSKLHLPTSKTEIPPEDFNKFIEYCKQDVRIERLISNLLGDLPERELPHFLLNQKVNLRGLRLDYEGIEKAIGIVDARAEKLNKMFRAITGLNATQRDKALQWFNANGLKLDNLRADYLEELLEEGLPKSKARDALELRLRINKASTKKLNAMARQCGSDGIARFQSRYHGAQTGRETGTGIQPLNLSRGWEDVDPECLVRDIGYGDADYLDMVYGDAIEAVGRASRHYITAREGNRILAGDFASIEAIGLSILAGEEWKVDAFRRGVKIYEHMADKIYKLAPGTVTKATHPQERQDGKTAELACGYQGSLGAWRKFDSSDRHSDERVVEIVKMWRQEHPMIQTFWRELESAAIQAVRSGSVHGYRDIGFETVDDWLSMILPNGKRIWYWRPELRLGWPNWHKPLTDEACALKECDCEQRIQLSYHAQKMGQWGRVFTYGGKLAENATQATCREVLKPAEHALEKAGYPLVLSVYDEIVCDVPKGKGSKKEFQDIMQSSREPWFADWPITVEVWEGYRYRK